jgi:hypothetical protein
MLGGEFASFSPGGEAPNFLGGNILTAHEIECLNPAALSPPPPGHIVDANCPQPMM